MDPIKEAFSKVKQEMDVLKEEMKIMKKALLSLYNHQTTSLKNTPEQTGQTDKPTDKTTLEGIKRQNIGDSIGNRGVPTDRQTNQQTNQQTEIPPPSLKKTGFAKASEVMDSLESVRQEIKEIFTNLTRQEFKIFSTIYNLEEIGMKEITYRAVAEKLSLSESSIRDYTNKLMGKGVPIHKTRQKNKTILLSIAPDLKKVASLKAISSLKQP